jgi:hypothetical protein
MRVNPDLMERYRSGQTDPFMELDLDRPSPWALRNVMPTQPVQYTPSPAEWLRLLHPILTAI